MKPRIIYKKLIKSSIIMIINLKNVNERNYVVFFIKSSRG